MGGISALGHAFHGAVVILKALELNGKEMLVQLIAFPDRATLIKEAGASRPAIQGSESTMTAITTIRIDHAALPRHFDLSRPDAVAEAIEAALRDEGITAEASDVISHIKIELPTTQLAAASTMLASLQLI